MPGPWEGGGRDNECPEVMVIDICKQNHHNVVFHLPMCKLIFTLSQPLKQTFKT